MAPGGSLRVEVPGVSSRYFSPSEERSRTITVVSAGSSCRRFSSFRVMTALTAPVRGSWWGASAETVPTRVPPMRTSLPTCRLLASGTCTLMSYVGTNGRPLFAL